jgi:hypothetical protein
MAFDLEAATGPHRLDLGDTLYAPTLLREPGSVRRRPPIHHRPH